MAHSPRTIPYNTPSLRHILLLFLGHERINVQDKGVCHLNLTQTKKNKKKQQKTNKKKKKNGEKPHSLALALTLTLTLRPFHHSSLAV